MPFSYYVVYVFLEVSGLRCVYVFYPNVLCEEFLRKFKAPTVEYQKTVSHSSPNFC